MNRLKKVFVSLLVIVGVLAPAIVNASVMLGQSHHQTVTSKYDEHNGSYANQSANAAPVNGEPTNDLSDAMPDCHDQSTESSLLSRVQSADMAHTTNTTTNAESCCEVLCDCSSACSAQMALVSTLLHVTTHASAYQPSLTSLYASVSLTPLSPPPNA